ncbi:Crp/Fnr family transcriptional regulator [Bradyrhizobium sp. Ash2021]|uniref:Crp/Fnr family transcriptional regulator n=1 Tax=Bradyrhizobium sp. Ash2021 TaxID=2954771 RepID=UPI0028149C82|nr:Crp/Fnr family transcriptional regulator [Bradyrhizobium sp. Ash2021]WMT72085.1 Crp/Fnr family transcriptional regulator [Bradyrhizobium sp. Ash2021]
MPQFSQHDFDILRAACAERVYAPGERIFTQGIPHTATYLILSGLVRTYYTSAIGNEITLAFWSKGDWIGGPDLFGREPNHIWSAEAVEKSSVLALPGPRLMELAAKIPAVAMAVIEALIFKLKWVSLLLQTLGTELVSERLAHLLIKLGEVHGETTSEGIVIRYPFSQEDLAAMVGASRQWVNRAFARLRREGIVCQRQRHIILKDPDRLARGI